MTIQNFRFI